LFTRPGGAQATLESLADRIAQEASAATLEDVRAVVILYEQGD
jgi:hypothetical protein